MTTYYFKPDARYSPKRRGRFKPVHMCSVPHELDPVGRPLNTLAFCDVCGSIWRVELLGGNRSCDQKWMRVPLPEGLRRRLGIHHKYPFNLGPWVVPTGLPWVTYPPKPSGWGCRG